MAKWDRFEQTQTGLELGWTKSDSRRKIWGLSHTHLANAIDQFSSWLEPVDDSPVREATAALTGFAWLAELEERIELTQPLAAACADFVTGLTEGDQERTIRGYSAVETIVSRIRARFGYDLGRSWNKQGIDEEFDHLVEASALLVDRLKHENLTDTDTRNTYDLAVKIAHGWKTARQRELLPAVLRTVLRGCCSHHLGDGRTTIRNECTPESSTSVELGIPTGRRIHDLRGRRPAQKGRSRRCPRCECPAAVMSRPTDGRAVEGHPNRWSVEVVLSDPRIAGSSSGAKSSDVGAESREGTYERERDAVDQEHARPHPTKAVAGVVPPPKFVRAASSSAVAACPGRYSPIVGHIAPTIASTIRVKTRPTTMATIWFFKRAPRPSP